MICLFMHELYNTFGVTLTQLENGINSYEQVLVPYVRTINVHFFLVQAMILIYSYSAGGGGKSR